MAKCVMNRRTRGWLMMRAGRIMRGEQPRAKNRRQGWTRRGRKTREGILET